MRFSLRVQVKILVVLLIFLFAMACYYGVRGEEAANAAPSCAYTFTDASGASIGVYSDPSYSTRVCQDAALSAYTTYYVQINSPTVADGGSVDYLHIHDSVDTQVSFGDGSDTRALTLQPGGPPYVWRTSFTTPTTTGVYGLESRIMNGSQTSQVHINGWRATVGYPAAYVRTYTDGTYTQTTDSYSAGAVVYAEIYDPIFLDDVPSVSNSTITVGDFSGGLISVTPTLSHPGPKKFRIEFALPGPGGDKYVSMAIRNSASTLLADPRTLIRIDSTAPVVSNIEPSGITLTTSPVIRASISDGSGSGIDPDSAVIFVHGSLRSNCTITEYAISCPATPLDQGLHVIDISVRDYAGNTGTGTGSFIIDYSPPAVMNIQPSGNVTGTSATVSAYFYDSASGIDASSSSVKVDGVTISGCERTASTISCPVSGLAYGAHAISVTVRDMAGNIGSSTGSFTVFADPAPLRVENIQPSGAITGTAASISAYFGNNDFAIDAASATAYLDGVALDQCSRTVDTISCAVSGLVQGAHSISVSVRDSYGNTGTGTGGFYVDSIAPVVSISLPADTIETTTATIAATYADGGSGVNAGAVSVDVDGVPLSGCYVHADAVYCSVSGLALGAHSINASVRDNAGNTGTASRGFTVVETSTPDVTAPTISAISPAGGFTPSSIDVSAGFSDTGSGIDVGSAMVSMDGVTLAGCAVDTVSIHCHVDGLAEGPHEIFASIADNAGNGSSVSFSFTAEGAAPIISNVQPSGWVSSSEGAAITADFSDGAGSGVNPDSVTVKANNQIVTGCTVTPVSVSCPTPGNNNNYIITITAYDYAGNMGIGTATFQRDLRGPMFYFLNGGRVLATNSPVISLNVREDGGADLTVGSGLASVEVYVEGAGILSCTVRKLDNFNNMHDCPAAGLSEGRHSLKFSAWDVAGNFSTFDTFIYIDTMGPSVTGILPSGTISTTSPVLTANYSDSIAGIDTTATVVKLDGVARSECTITVNGVSCPTMGLAQGAHSIDITVQDIVGNIASSTGYFTVSTVAPSVTSILPYGHVSTTSPEISARYIDHGAAVDTASVVVSVDGAVLGGCTVSVTEVRCPSSGLAHGMHTVSVNVSDLAGGTDSGASTFFVDLETPIISTWVTWGRSSPLEIILADQDSGMRLTSVSISIDGTVWKGHNLDLRADGSVYISGGVNGLTNGAHTLSVSASDNAGNLATKITSFEFNMTPPEIYNILPFSWNPYLADTITADLSDGTGPGINPDSVIVKANSQIVTGCTVTPTSVSCPRPGNDNYYSIVITAHDYAGNMSTGYGFFVVDPRGPQFHSVQPDGQVLAENSTMISMALLDDRGTVGEAGSGVASVEVYVEGAGVLSCRPTQNFYTYFDCPVKGLAEGRHSLNISAWDVAGNRTARDAFFSVDTMAPSVIDILPNGTASTASPVISAHFSDATSGVYTDAITVSLDGVVLSGCTATATDISCQTPGFAHGQHAITVSVPDLAGNITNATSSFIVPLLPGRPPLGVSLQRAYWASYADFQARELSLSWSVSNGGFEPAIALTIVGSSNTGGVTLSTMAPWGVGDIAASTSAAVDLKYHIPTGVSSFKTTVYATARDNFNNSYAYPGPYPGA